MKYTLLLIGITNMFWLSSFSLAKDLGSYTSLEKIIEEDMLEVIHKQLKTKEASGELDQLNSQIQTQVKEHVKRPKKVANIGKSTKSYSQFIDPSITLKKDIFDPNGVIIYKKGYIVNPLDYMIFDETWIFIDGDDEHEAQFADELIKASNKKTTADKIKIILVNGNPGLNTEKDIFYYFDQNGFYCQKFNIKTTPAIIKQADKKMEIKYVKLPS